MHLTRVKTKNDLASLDCQVTNEKNHTAVLELQAEQKARANNNEHGRKTLLVAGAKKRLEEIEQCIENCQRNHKALLNLSSIGQWKHLGVFSIKQNTDAMNCQILTASRSWRFGTRSLVWFVRHAIAMEQKGDGC
jgi:hypothetical protein